MLDLSDQQLCGLALGTSLTVILMAYLIFSRRFGSYVNILTPFMLVGVPSYYILEGLNLGIFGYKGSVYAYTYVYVTYAVGFLSRIIGYLVMPPRWVPAFIQLPTLRVPGLPYVLLVLAYALYAPVLVAHSDLLLSPREIYIVTRTGFGIQTFLSTFLVYIGFIVLLLRETRTRRVLGFVLPALALLYLHGSKGQVFGLFLIWLYVLAFVRGRRFAIGRLVGLGVGSSLVIFGLFYLTEPESFRADLIDSVVGYAGEYTRNAMLVIDDHDLEPKYGELTLENSYYGLIPRQLFPDKRKDFGSLWLANRYFPERFQADQGAPAFGLGTLYADFGVFAMLYYGVSELVTGMILRLLAYRLEMRPDAGTLVLFLALMDVPLIPTGVSLSMVVYYVIAQVVKCIAGNPRPAAGVSLRVRQT